MEKTKPLKSVKQTNPVAYQNKLTPEMINRIVELETANRQLRELIANLQSLLSYTAFLLQKAK